ncbi:hypothetical protein ScPMuIL_013290 [Solemya velum]
MADQPSKSDIQGVFKRLRSLPTNKQCFDCNSNNPTWASVTYGVFLCIDCSAVHRSLGVHVTFIRSTQLDTNWTWIQLRAMQVGGNANATSFFRQHGCLTKDSQQKYHSRAAKLYKEKVHHMATQAMRLHGTKLHIHNPHHEPTSPDQKEVDFFQEHTELKDEKDYPALNGIADNAKLSSVTSAPQPIKNGNIRPVEDTDEGPNVHIALSMSPTQAVAQAEPRKALIGSKKTGTKKGKKLGAQKVKTDFSQIENRAQQLDKEREDLANARVVQEMKTKEDQEKQMASMRLAYKDMSIQRKKEEDKLKVSDPKKAEQMDRLGMGFAGSRELTHSVMSDIKAIEQETPKGTSSYDSFSRPERSNRFFEDELDSMTGFTSGSQKDDFGSWGSSNKSGSWDIDRFNSKQQNLSETISSKEDERPSRARKNYESAPTGDDAQKKFGSAKSISSDQYFGNRDPDYEMRQNLAKYEGSSGISSSDLFGGDAGRKPTQSTGPDLQDIKDGVRQGVTKVAGKLSLLANGVMNTLQDRYG